MKYVLLATLSAAAFGQTSWSGDSPLNDADRIAALASKLNGLTSSAAVSRAGDDDRNNNNGSPVLLQQVSRRSVEWTRTPAACSLLTSDVTGSGQGRTTITVVRNPDRTFNYKINDEVSGTATDSENHHYIFLYVNNAFVDSGRGIPSPQRPYNSYGTDVFQLIPVDGGVGYTTTFYFKALVNADGSFTDQGSVATPNVLGGPGSGRQCDPI